MRIIFFLLAMVTLADAQDARRRRTLPSDTPLTLAPSGVNAQVIATVPSLTPPVLPNVQTGKVPVSVRARYGKEGAIITKGLQWRVFLAAPNEDNSFTLISESAEPAPIFILDSGQYIVHASFGLATSVRKIDVIQEGMRELFQLNAGGMLLRATVADKRLPNDNLTFDLYQGSQFDGKEPVLLMKGARADKLVILPEGNYHIVSTYGDGNATVRADTKVTTGKITDAIMQHRAGEVNLKLVSADGKPLTNASFTIMNPAGDVVKESTGDSATIALLEGDYLAVARVDGKVLSQKFLIEAGIAVNVELVAK
jgi:hypothetical protein